MRDQRAKPTIAEAMRYVRDAERTLLNPPDHDERLEAMVDRMARGKHLYLDDRGRERNLTKAEKGKWWAAMKKGNDDGPTG